MRQSALFGNTLREIPAEAEAISHQLLVKAGFIRQLAAGVYTYLPLGWRVLRQMERILREELEQAGAQELLMPALQPAELWSESGRYRAYGPELMRLEDRHDREFVLGPTHEEVITALVKQEISSYRKLPLILYQIQTKFRDERRPRFGMIRGREFLMKDAYSFDAAWEGLDRSYRSMYEAYLRIFRRCGLNVKVVEADAGTIGGEGETHEFMALADIGEDTIVSCTACGYAANLEKAQSGFVETRHQESNVDTVAAIHTPGTRTIEQLTQSLQVTPQEIIKTLLYLADEQPIAVVVRGDHEVNEAKVKGYLHADTIMLADGRATEAVTGAAVGFVGPVGLSIPVLVDEAVVSLQLGICGANQTDYHLSNVVPGRDFPLERTGDFRNAKEGDRCLRCDEGVLRTDKGIEVGHVFKLGTKYSDAFGARFLDSNGREQALIMGCYGIGVSRLLSALVEQHHDERGMVWPPELAPFQVHLIPISVKDDTQMKTAAALYDQLRSLGVEVLLDDRDDRVGVKFYDSELIGIPIRMVIGRDAEKGSVELVIRSTNEKQIISIEEALSRVLNALH
jgi:prolyl-tRNA synthetase